MRPGQSPPPQAGEQDTIPSEVEPEEGADGVEEGEPAAEEELQQEEFLPIETSGVAIFDHIRQLWNTQLEYSQLGDKPSRQQFLDEILDEKANLGLNDMPLYAAAVLRLSEKAREKGDVGEADFYADLALRFAPDTPFVHFALARMAFERNPFSPGAYTSKLIDGLKKSLSQYDSQTMIAANAIFIVLIGLFYAFIVFLAINLPRHFKLLAHDFKHLLPKAVTPLIARIVLLTLMVLPLLMLVNPLWVLLGWMVLFSMYFTKSGKAIALSLLVLIAISPLAANVFASLIYNQNVGIIDELAAVQSGRWNAEDISELSNYLEEHDSDADALFSLAVAYQFLGEYEKARSYYQRVDALGQYPLRIASNLGVLAMQEGDQARAMAQFDEALQQNPTYTVARYNKGKLYYSNTDLEKAMAELDAAREVASDQVLTWEADSKSGVITRYFVIDVLPRSRINERFFVFGSEAREFTDSIWNSFFGANTPVKTSIIAVVMIVCSLLFWLLHKRLNLSGLCITCGQPACSRCAQSTKKQKRCSQCQSVYVLRTGISPELKNRKDFEVKRYKSRRRILSLLDLILPGAGHYIKGLVLRGFILSLITGCLAGWWFFSLGISRGLVIVAADSIQPGRILAGSLFVLVYLIGIFDNIREA